MLFQGVHTTGIYCRADCSARPLRRNTEPFPSTVAAEAAGFRPCLQCRPDRHPDRLLQRPAPAAVEQSLLLISDGFLDRNNEDALARRVGYSVRQLRRAFHRYVGATPTFVAQSRRAHFARRLLDESDLPIGRISAAAGFSSTRQMNRVIKDVFRFPPSELRAKRRTGDRLVIDGGLRLRVPYEGALDWKAALRFLAPRAIPGIEQVGGSSYRRVTTTCGYPGVLEVEDHGDGRHLEITAHLPTYTSIVDDIQRIRHLFGLDDPPEASELARDPLLGRVVRTHPGLRIVGAWDRFEASVRILLGQQVSVAAAGTLAGRVVDLFGTRFDALAGTGLDGSFPAAPVLAEAPLEQAGMPGSRAETIRRFAAAVSSGDIDLYATGDLAHLTEPLQAIRGIGPWTAHLVAMRVYRHPDAFPSSDLGVRKAIGRLREGSRPEPADAEALASIWRPHRAMAVQHLWQTLQED
jgi:AraC family transcriptional regulator of adaptative response / DNA-3-methyladenine glycosylase II